MQSNVIKSFSQNTLISFSTEILILVFGLISSIILARVLGPEGRGIYALTTIIPSLFIVFSSLGLEFSNVYFVGSKKYKIQDVVSTSFVLAMVIGLAVVLLFWGISHFDFFQNFIQANKVSSFHLWMIIMIVPLFLILNFFGNIIRGRGDIITYNLLGLLQYIIEIAALIIFLLILKQGVSGAIFSYVLSIIGVAIFAIVFIKRISKITLFINKKLLQESFSYGGKIYLASTLSYLNHRLSLLLVGIFLAPFVLGIYSIASGVAEKLFLIPRAVATALFPKISSLNSFEASSFTPKVVRHTFFILIVISLVLGMLSVPLIRILLGREFLPSVVPLLILLPGIVGASLGRVINTDLIGRGKTQFAVYSSFVRLIVNILLIILFVPKWGISGVAFATTIAYWVDTLIILAAFLKISQKPLPELLLIKKEDFRDYYNMFLNIKGLLKNRLWKIEN